MTRALSTQSRKKGPCFHCGGIGHYKRDCWKLSERKAESQKETKGGKHKTSLVTEQDSSSDNAEVMVVGHALSIGPFDSWIVDSGATSHMCTSRELFTEYISFQNPGEVTVGDGRVLNVVCHGTVGLLMRLSGGKVKKCVLQDVLHVPDLSCNLVSVSKASEMGKVTEFDDSGCWFKNSDGKVVAMATMYGSLYFLDCQPCEQANVVGSKEDLWHKRYGHLGYDSLRQLAAAGGAEYFVTFIDDKSRYVWLYVLKSKSEVFSKFGEWMVMVEWSTGRKLKVLRSDNGGEYTSGEVAEFLVSEGIRHELTVSKSPQQYGVAERLNRTLVEMTRSLLAGSGLPQKLWAETLSTAVYLRNRRPTKAVDRMTPFEAFHGKRPDVGHLRVFGCVCFTHIAKDERKKQS